MTSASADVETIACVLIQRQDRAVTLLAKRARGTRLWCGLADAPIAVTVAHGTRPYRLQCVACGTASVWFDVPAQPTGASRSLSKV